MTVRFTMAMLETLVAFTTERSVSAAARRLGVSQPAVSSNLARFERLCGFPLVTRSPSGSELTPAGRELAEVAEEALSAAGRVAQRIEDLGAQGVRPLRVAASMTIAEDLLPDWVLAADQLEMSDVEVVVGNSQLVRGLVERASADLGFIEGANPARGLTNVVVGEDRLVWIAAPRLARELLARGARVADLVAGPLFVREQGSGTREVLDVELERQGLALGRLTTSLGSTSAIKAAVRRGAGVGVVSERAVQDEFASGALVAVPVPGVDLRRRLRAIWVPAARLDGRAAALIGAARQGGNSVHDE